MSPNTTGPELAAKGGDAVPAVTSESDFDCLRDAVTIAKRERIRSATQLRSRLLLRGHSDNSIEAAIAHWAHYEARKWSEFA